MLQFIIAIIMKKWSFFLENYIIETNGSLCTFQRNVYLLLKYYNVFKVNYLHTFFRFILLFKREYNFFSDM